MQSPFELIKKSLIIIGFWWLVLSSLRMREVGINSEGFFVNFDSILLLALALISMITICFFLFLFDSEKASVFRKRVKPVIIDGMHINLGNHFPINPHKPMAGKVRSSLPQFRNQINQMQSNKLAANKLLKYENVFETMFNAKGDPEREKINEYLSKLADGLESFKYTGISTTRPMMGKNRAINLKNNPLAIFSALFAVYTWVEIRNSKSVSELNLYEKRVLFQAKGIYDIYYKIPYNQSDSDISKLLPEDGYKYPQIPIHIIDGKQVPLMDEPIALIELERFINGFKPLSAVNIIEKEDAYSAEMVFNLFIELISENDRINGKVADKRIGMFADGDIYLYNDKFFKELRKIFRLNYPQFSNKIATIPMTLYSYLNENGFLNVSIENNDGDFTFFNDGELLTVEWVASDSDKTISTNGILRIKAIGTLSHIRSIVKKATNYPRIKGIDDSDAIEGSVAYEKLFGKQGRPDNELAANSAAIINAMDHIAQQDISKHSKSDSEKENEQNNLSILADVNNELSAPVADELIPDQVEPEIDIDAELQSIADDDFSQIDFLGDSDTTDKTINHSEDAESDTDFATIDFLGMETQPEHQDSHSSVPLIDAAPNQDNEISPVPKPRAQRKKPEPAKGSETSRLSPPPKVSNTVLKARLTEHMLMLRGDFFSGTRLDHVKQEDSCWTIFNTHLHEFFDQSLISALGKFQKEENLYAVSFNYSKPDDQTTKRVKQVKLVRIYKSAENKLYKNISAEEWTATNIRTLLAKMHRQLESMKKQDKTRLGVVSKLLPAKSLYHTIFTFPKENLGTIFGEHATVIQNLLNCIEQYPNDTLFIEAKKELSLAARNSDGTETFIELQLLKAKLF